MHFDLKKQPTAGITYKDDGQIPVSKLKDKKIVNTNSIVFLKPYKLQIRASKMVAGNRNIVKKTIVFPTTTTLLDAIKESSKVYEKMMNDLENGTHKIDVDVINEDTFFCVAWNKYHEYKVLDYKAKGKPEYSDKQAQSFYKNYLKPIHHKPLNQITKQDITKIKAKMSGLSERTKRWVNQYVNPVYGYVNDNYRVTLKSPASLRGLAPLRNEREVDISNDEIVIFFKQLNNYSITPFREFFMFAMHGRRKNEILTLEWKDVDLDKNTYIIRAENNKTRIDMTYGLTERLRASLDILRGINNIQEMSGLVFKNAKDGTIRNHWQRLNAPIVMHDLRKCIVQYLKNKKEVSDEVCGYILGHTQNKSITQRYGRVGHKMLADKLNLMLDEIFDDEYSKKDDTDEKLTQLQALFPDKSIEQLKAFLGEKT